jgi:hypothetical protein
MNSFRQFLDKETFNSNAQNLKVTKVKKTDKGYIVHLFTNYVCLYYKYITVNKNGSAKIVTKVNCNYQSKYQVTTYENSEGKDLTAKEYKILNK